jgi:hypothetical protein
MKYPLLTLAALAISCSQKPTPPEAPASIASALEQVTWTEPIEAA